MIGRKVKTGLSMSPQQIKVTPAYVAWHRPQSTPCRVEKELMEKSAHALATATNPVERLRLLCLSRGASGILILARIFRELDDNGSKHLNKDEFLAAIKGTGLDISDKDAEELFAQFDPQGRGSMSIDEFIEKIRPPMSEGRRAIVTQAFKKLDKKDEGFISVEDLRKTYSCDDNPRYKSGEEAEELIMKIFLANFETEGIVNGKVTLEDFMNYYSGISVSMEDDCYFDLVMRQCFKL